MNIKNLFAILLALALLVSTFIIQTSAKESTNDNVEIIISNENISTETKEKIIKHFATGEPATNDSASNYGLTCTLFGHKLENSIVEVTTHKVRSTAPRCLEKTYAYSACTRCDYETSEVIDSEYIYCCS